MSDDWKTQNTLLLRAKDQSDEEAWDDFTNYYKSFIDILIYKIVGKHPHHDDMLQTILMELWKSLSRFELDPERAKFRTWMSRVVRNTVLDYIKKERREPMATEIFPESRVQESELEGLIQKEWETHISRLAMEKISQKFRGNAIRVFEMSMEGKSVDAICEELNIHPNSAYTLKNRVKKAVTQEIRSLQQYLEQ